MALLRELERAEMSADDIVAHESMRKFNLAEKMRAGGNVAAMGGG